MRMKAIAVLIGVMMMWASTLSAQVATGEELMSVNYTLDFSGFIIDEISAKDYLELGKGVDYEEFMKSAERNLTEEANRVLMKRGLTLTNEQPSHLLLKIIPLKADDDGEHYFRFELTDKESGFSISKFKINSDGGNRVNFQVAFLKGLLKTGHKLGNRIVNALTQFQQEMDDL